MTEVTQQQQQFLTIAEEERGVSISSLLSGIESVSHKSKRDGGHPRAHGWMAE